MFFTASAKAGYEWSPGKTVQKGKTNVFVMDWTDHPEKTQDWYMNGDKARRWKKGLSMSSGRK